MRGPPTNEALHRSQWRAGCRPNSAQGLWSGRPLDFNVPAWGLWHPVLQSPDSFAERRCAMRLNIHLLPILLILLVLLFFTGETRMHALSQCKVDWMNHPAASGTITGSDYLAACMESHGYRRRVACLATADSESCYDPTSFQNKLRSMVELD